VDLARRATTVASLNEAERVPVSQEWPKSDGRICAASWKTKCHYLREVVSSAICIRGTLRNSIPSLCGKQHRIEALEGASARNRHWTQQKGRSALPDCVLEQNLTLRLNENAGAEQTAHQRSTGVR
jgi:hypothetical protein